MRKEYPQRNKPTKPTQTKTSHADIKKQLQAILHDIKMQADPEDLNAIRKLFRSTVPLSYRSYVAAYMLKHGSFHASPAADHNASYKKLFINSGHMHRLNTPQLKKLLCNIDGVSEEHIGRINIFRTYSFVEITESFTHKVITSLTGYKLPSGKPLSVSLAKRKFDNQ